MNKRKENDNPIGTAKQCDEDVVDQQQQQHQQNQAILYMMMLQQQQQQQTQALLAVIEKIAKCLLTQLC